MNKVYARINWKNYPSENTPLNESNLNKIDYGLNEVDNRVIELDTTKVSSASLSDNIKSWSMDETTGIVTIEKYSGEQVLFDLNTEKIPVSFSLSDDGILTMTTDDGTQFTADIGSMIPVLTFEDSDTIAVTVSGTGVNKTYSFSIKNGSVTGDMLEENYLANINVKVAESEGYANASSTNATASGNSATLSESWAVGGTGAREGEDTNNAKYWSERAESVSQVEIATTEKAGIVKPDGTTISISDDGTISSSFNITIDSEMSDTSENPVQNKVIKNYVDSHKDTLVMSADGVHGLRYHEDKLEAKDSEGTWHEISTGGGGGGIPLAEPTNTSLENADESVVIKWTDPDDIVVSGSTIAKWDGTVIVRKVGSAPTSKTDGVLIVDSKVKNQYATNGFTDNGLDNGTEYFYGFFPYTDKNVYTTTKISSITPSEIYPTAPSNVSVEKGNALATVSFTIAEDTTSAKIVYGTHTPTSPSDGTVIETTTSPYTIEGLVNDTTYYIVVYAFNAKGRYTASDVVEATPKSIDIVTFADGTWEQINAMLEAHYNDEINISDYWAVGDTRNVALSSMSATGVGESHRAQTVQLVIGDFEHDDLVTSINGHTKAAITLLQKDCLMDASNATNPTNGSSNTENGYMNSSNTNSGGWKSCARRTWCNNVYYSALPSVLKSMVKTVNKKVSVGNNSSTIEIVQDKIFLAAEIEIFGSTTYSFAGEGTQYQYYKNATANRYKMPRWSSNSSHVSNLYWERSPRSGNTTYFCVVNLNGSADSNNASNARGVAPCLCL